jgi:hypothetical protein
VIAGVHPVTGKQAYQPKCSLVGKRIRDGSQLMRVLARSERRRASSRTIDRDQETSGKDAG